MRPPHARSGHPFPRNPIVWAALTVLALPSTGSAAESLAARSPTWDLSREELEAVGLGQSRGDPVVVPDDAPRVTFPGEPKAASQGRIFVNFDGAQLSSGWDDSHSDTTQIGECAGSFAAYGEGTKRDAVMQAVRDDWAPYNVIITDSRPASGDYTMNMTGPSNPFGGGVLGIAPLDCDDSQTHNNITFAFHSVNDQFDASTTATTIGQEVAHSYGLEHVDEPGDIMNPYNAGGDPSFTDNCLTVVGGSQCGSQHAAECGSGGSQNSHQELMTLFGASAPDNASPTVSITAPSDGSEYDVGATFEITVDAADDIGIESVALFNNGEQIETDGSSPYGWTVQNAPAGSYEFYVEATDPSGNIAMSNTVTVSVGGVQPSDDSGDGGEAGSDGSADDGGDSGGGTGDGGSADDAGTADGGSAFDEGGDGGLPPGFGNDRGAEGCACTSDRTSQHAWWMLLVLLPIARKRRR